MTPKFLFCLILCFFLLTKALNRQQSQEETPDKRMLQVDKAGPYFLKNNLEESQTGRLLAEIRGFLWDHLQEHRLGQLQATVYTIEGDPTTYVFFVESDTKDRWYIRAKSESMLAALLKPGEKPRHETREVRYYDVERLDSETNQVIPKTEKRQSHTYRLRLKNENGPKNFVW
jgi:hypothetical protein